MIQILFCTFQPSNDFVSNQDLFCVGFNRRSCTGAGCGGSQSMSQYRYYHRSVFLSSFFSLRLLLLTHFRETPMCEIIFHPIFWHNQKIYAKKNIFFGKFYFIFLRKKGDFSDVFSAFCGQCSVTAAWATRSPWSILKCFLHKASHLDLCFVIVPGQAFQQKFKFFESKILINHITLLD